MMPAGFLHRGVRAVGHDEHQMAMLGLRFPDQGREVLDADAARFLRQDMAIRVQGGIDGRRRQPWLQA